MDYLPFTSYLVLSANLVKYVNQLFELEDKIRQKHAGDYEATQKVRLEKEKPVVVGFDVAETVDTTQWLPAGKSG